MPRAKDLLAHRQRLERAITLAIAATPYEEIAVQCGWNSKQAAHKAVRSAIIEIARPEAQYWFSKNLLRLEALIAAKWEAATDPTNDGHAQAIEQVRSFIKDELAIFGVGTKLNLNIGPGAGATINSGPAAGALILANLSPEKQSEAARLLQQLDNLAVAEGEGARGVAG